MKTQLLMAAAGLGRRLGLHPPKALAPILGKPLLIWTLKRFIDVGLTEKSLIVCPQGFEETFEAVLEKQFPRLNFSIITGGDMRQESVAKGLEKLDADTEIVVVHDAARPFVTLETIKACLDAAMENGAATAAMPCIDTILESTPEGYLAATPPRETLWACQTPQTFRAEVIRAAHRWATHQNYTVTDDASLVRATGGRVKLVVGSSLNFKITTSADLKLAEQVIQGGLA